MPAEDAAEAVEEPVVVDESQEEKETPETTEETDQPEESEESPELDKEIQSRDAQIKHWRDKAQKFEKEAKKTPKVESETSETDDFRPRVEFLLSNRDLEEKEYSHISAVAMRDSGEITLESLQTAKETEKDYLSFLKEKADNKRKSPGSTSSGGAPSSVKTFAEIGEMSPEEHRALDEKAMNEESQGI